MKVRSTRRGRFLITSTYAPATVRTRKFLESLAIPMSVPKKIARRIPTIETRRVL
jgi:hypothetical protein